MAPVTTDDALGPGEDPDADFPAAVASEVHAEDVAALAATIRASRPDPANKQTGQYA